MATEFLGYERPDGQVGLRNHLLVMATCDCSHQEAIKIATAIPSAVAVTQWYGCRNDPLVASQMIGIANNPNVGATLLVGHGCESITVDILGQGIDKTKKALANVVSQRDGGTIKTIEKGIRILRDMATDLSKEKMKSFDITNLIVAVECGGSDATSGLAANPAVGNAIDKLIDAGGTAIFSEPIEMTGTEHILARRAVNKGVASKIYALVHNSEKWAKARGIPSRFMSKGNLDGGLSTIEEKSLGAILKGGTRSIQGVLENSRNRLEHPAKPGLYLQDGTGWDVPSVTHMLAIGAQIVLFTTGRGATTGHAIAPVIKVTGNPITFSNMEDNIDVNAGRIIEGKAGITAVGEEIFNLMVRVASGEKTKTEMMGYNDFVIWRSDPVADHLIQTCF
ncbi:UxaA family hydrolase [Candidatus Bathyarchaeota archaeon]|nr:UxaA family hydrolase [Candidatus Bathyarchaeota archaeon]